MTIRDANTEDAALISHIQRVCWVDTYKDIIDESYLSSLKNSDNTTHWLKVLKDSKLSSIILLEDNKEVGFATWGPCRLNKSIYTYELYSIYIYSQYRGHHIGTVAVEYIKQRISFEKLFVWVLFGSPSVNFYKSIGQNLLFEQRITLAGKEYLEISFEV